MNYYYRKITKRVRVNRCGKIGFRPFLQVVKTDNIELDKIYEYEVEW